MSTGHVLMGLLAGGDRHGYDLKRAHDDRFVGARPLAFGQVYATLERLVKKGHVEPVEVARVEGPDRTVYRLTDAGRAELEVWIDELEPPAPFVTNPLAVRATVALLLGDPARATKYLRNQRRAHLERMRELTSIKTDPATSLAGVLAADYAVAHLDADLRWLETAIARTADLTDRPS